MRSLNENIEVFKFSLHPCKSLAKQVVGPLLWGCWFFIQHVIKIQMQRRETFKD